MAETAKFFGILYFMSLYTEQLRALVETDEYCLPGFHMLVVRPPCIMGLFCGLCDLDFLFPLTFSNSVFLLAEHSETGAAQASRFSFCVEGSTLCFPVGFHTICPHLGLLPKSNKCRLKSSIFPVGT